MVPTKLGKHEEAEEMYRETLQLWRKVQGEEHPKTLTSMNNLGLGADRSGEVRGGGENASRELQIDRMLKQMKELERRLGRSHETGEIKAVLSLQDVKDLAGGI